MVFKKRQNMQIKDAIQYGAQLLPQSDSAQIDAEYLLLFCLNAQRNILFTHPEKELTVDENTHFQNLLKRRQQGEPVAYIIERQGFWDLDLKVSPHTLIPRGDTESLIDWLLEQPLKPNTILDLGTGTGALALALAREYSSAQVTGIDVVEQAVALAQENKKLNKIHNVIFKQSNWFDAIDAENKFDLIVSNPPYIDSDDHHLEEGDVRFEPSSALVAAQSGYADLFKISLEAKEYLNAGGCLIMEHGWQQAPQVREHLIGLAYENVGSGFDLAGHERFTFAFKK